jgi:hypothetical protein
MRKDFSKLRESLDSNDSFMTGGHQIVKTAGATLHAERMQRVPVWALDQEKVKQILLSAFPKLQTDDLQRSRAAKWATVINYYYRMGWTQTMIAEEMKLPLSTIKSLIIRIKRVAAGKQTADPKKLRGQRHRGRPKIVHL